MDVMGTIRQAIKERKPIIFEYDDGLDGERIGNPHIIFMHKLKSGKVSVYLHLWQTEGVSKSNVPDWKTHLCDKIKSARIIHTAPQFTIAEGYNEESPMYEIVIEKVLL